MKTQSDISKFDNIVMYMRRFFFNPSLNTVLILLFSSLLASCVTAEKCSKKFANQTITITDTVSIKETIVVKDTIIQIKADTIKLTVPSPCDSLGNLNENFHYEQSSSKTKVVLKTRDNKIVAECICLEQQLRIQTLNRLLEKNRSTSHHQVDKIVLPVKHIPWYAKWYLLLVVVIIAFLEGRFRIIQNLIKLII